MNTSVELGLFCKSIQNVRSVRKRRKLIHIRLVKLLRIHVRAKQKLRDKNDVINKENQGSSTAFKASTTNFATRTALFCHIDCCVVRVVMVSSAHIAVESKQLIQR